jgi:DNA-binding transcriptional regulator YhcF (GntR family)
MLDKEFQISKKVESYLDKLFMIRPVLKRWSEEKSLPLFLREQYAFFTVDLLEKRMLFAIEKGGLRLSTSSIGKHLNKIQEKWPGLVAYVTEDISGSERSRLIEKQIPFLVPDNQMFLPMLGVDLQERFRTTKEKRGGFSPATQVLILDAIYSQGERIYSVAESAKRLGYSAMTLSRVFDELDKANIGTHRTRGRSREVIFPGSKKEFWNAALPYLKNPVQKTVYIMREYSGKEVAITGMSALSHYTNLSEPDIHTIGIEGKTWLKLKDAEIHVETRAPEPDWTAVEVWSYPPLKYARDKVADPLSVFLSLRDSHDERTRQALDELLKREKW